MSKQPEKRKPRAFDVTPEEPPKPPPPEVAIKTAPRKPRAIEAGPELEMEAEDYFEREGPDADEIVVAEVERQRRRISFASVAVAAIGLFASLAAGLWIDSIVRALFERNPWLGWFSAGLAAVIAFAVMVVVMREISAVFRLRRVDHLRGDLESALAGSSERDLNKATDRLIAHMAANPLSASGRKILEEQDGEIIDARDRYELAERELFRTLDRDAFVLVMGSSRRVSVVTAVAPRAFLDILYVLFENFRLVRRLCELYGGRAGTFGNLRLFRNVLGHLAVTGAASLGDGLVQQVIGHGVASRLSARLGEGVLNGLMTARVGIAAMEVCRPAPFHAVSRPKLSSVLSTLTSGPGDVKDKGNGAL
jgi:putative membrane protein